MKKELLQAAAQVVPSERQLKWSEIGFSGLLSFGMNTFTDSEIGTGGESPELFNPEKLNVRRWVKIAKSSGMKGLIFTAKHCDGFCNWPSKYTEHSVKNSPWKDGNGDLVKEVSDACREYDIKFGVYITVWDRHEMSYGKGEEYDNFFKSQLRELLTNYGDIYCVWIDDVCRETLRGRHQEYDWDGYYSLIRELQPEAVIAGRGPDVRWCGNNRGVCRSSEWSVVPYYYSDVECLKEENRKVKKPPKTINMAMPDVGSRAVVKKGYPMIWYPAEVNIPLRTGWFYHLSDEYSVKPLSKIVDFYYKSVGANASMLLGICPKPDGEFAEDDINNLISLGAQLKIDFKEDLAQDSVMTASGCLDSAHEPANVLLAESDKFWHSGFDEKKPWIMIDLGDEYDIDKVLIKEHIKDGQQIEEFTLYAEVKGKWKKLSEGTVIGSKRICLFEEIRIRRMKLVIEKTRGFAAIEKFEAY